MQAAGKAIGDDGFFTILCSAGKMCEVGQAVTTHNTKFPLKIVLLTKFAALFIFSSRDNGCHFSV